MIAAFCIVKQRNAQLILFAIINLFRLACVDVQSVEHPISLGIFRTVSFGCQEKMMTIDELKRAITGTIDETNFTLQPVMNRIGMELIAIVTEITLIRDGISQVMMVGTQCEASYTCQ